MIYYSLTLLVGFLVLFKSADQFIIGAVATVRNFQISPTAIGLTIVAFGTSAPEIFVSAISSFENKLGLAVGNIVGSNIFNILAVLSIPCFIALTEIGSDVLWLDYTVMLILALLLGVFGYRFWVETSVNIFTAVLLISIWLGYLTYLHQTLLSG